MKSFISKFYTEMLLPMEKIQYDVSSSYYDEEYFMCPGKKGWYDKGAFDITNEFHKLWADFCVKMLGMKQGSRVLEVGCALGNVVYWLKYFGMKAKGFDISSWAIENCHKEVEKDLWCGDATEPWNTSDGSYDFIVCRETMEHIKIEKVRSVFIEAYRTLKEGGQMLFTFANNRRDKEVLKQSNNTEADESHLTIAPIYWWLEEVERAGFIVDVRKTLFAISQPVSQKYDWDMIICVKPELGSCNEV